MIFVETLFVVFVENQPDGKTQLTAAIFVFNRVIISRTEMLLGMQAITVPDLPCQKSIFIYKKYYYVSFYFANEKIFYAEDRAKMNREMNLFVLWEIGFLARQIGHGSTMR